MYKSVHVVEIIFQYPFTFFSAVIIFQQSSVRSFFKAPITTAETTFINTFSLFFFSEKIRLDISYESSAGQRIHIKHRVYFLQRIHYSKKNKCRLLQFLFGA